MASGEMWLPADADDSFIDTTLEFFNIKLNELAGNAFCTSEYSGINVCCYDVNTNEVVGCPYPQDGLVSNNIELDCKWKVTGEHWGTVRVDLLKKRLFPRLKGSFYPESYLWYDLALKYKVVCYNDKLRAYYIEGNSLTHSKTSRYDKRRVAISIHFQIWLIVKCGPKIFSYSPARYLKSYLDLVKELIKWCLASLFSIVCPRKFLL